MPALGLGLGLIKLYAGGLGIRNIINGALVLYNADDDTWYAFEIERIGTDPIFGPAIALATTPPANPSIYLLCPQDATVHEVICMTDEGGAPVMATKQENSGVAQLLSLDGFDLIIFKDEGGAYSAIPS